MVKTFCLMFLLSSSVVIAQNEKPEEDYFKRGLLKASATISPGKMLQNKANSIYISGFLEYALNDRYSLRGEVFQFVDASYSDASLL